MKKLIAFIILTIATAVLCSTKDRIDEVLKYIPTPSPPDLSIERCLREVPGFAERNSLPVISTGRGNMLDLRGSKDVARVHGDWCAEFGGVSMPAVTDSETNGIFLSCN